MTAIPPEAMEAAQQAEAYFSRPGHVAYYTFDIATMARALLEAVQTIDGLGSRLATMQATLERSHSERNHFDHEYHKQLARSGKLEAELKYECARADKAETRHVIAERKLVEVEAELAATHTKIAAVVDAVRQMPTGNRPEPHLLMQLLVHHGLTDGAA